ncbi:hypothetical protein HZB03_04890 [Candidatus Woesearchaeota archaeon]|nr:hypothetical protein [Candidatus Woesearchaeota archaeon]
MRKFSSFMDLTGQDRKLKCMYHGNTNVNLEARIMRETDAGLVVGVSLWSDDIDAHNYDLARRSLDIWYQQHPGVRIRLLPNTEFDVPKDIKEVNMYDVGQKVNARARRK